MSFDDVVGNVYLDPACAWPSPVVPGPRAAPGPAHRSGDISTRSRSRVTRIECRTPSTMRRVRACTTTVLGVAAPVEIESKT